MISSDGLFILKSAGAELLLQHVTNPQREVWRDGKFTQHDNLEFVYIHGWFLEPIPVIPTTHNNVEIGWLSTGSHRISK